MRIIAFVFAVLFLVSCASQEAVTTEEPTPVPTTVVPTETPSPTETPEPTKTRIPTSTPEPTLEPVPIDVIEAALREDGYRRAVLPDVEGGVSRFRWVKNNLYETATTWSDGRIELEVLHDSLEVRTDHMDQKFAVLDTVMPEGLMEELRRQYQEHNESLSESVSGDPEQVYSFAGDFSPVIAEYDVYETAIGGYTVRFSLWWWQGTCPAGYICFYEEFPGLEFTGDSSLIFNTIFIVLPE